MNICPKCNSEKIQKLNRGAKLGAVIGGASSLKKVSENAKNGATAGKIVFSLISFGKAGEIGEAIGGIAGAISGALQGAIVGGATGMALDKTILDNRKCNECNHEWHEEN